MRGPRHWVSLNRLRATAVFAVALFGLLCSGCAAYTRAEVGLAEQARKGVALWAAREEAHASETTRQFTTRRKALDDAFDADVKSRSAAGAIDSAWVIESRKGYAIGVDAIARAELAARQADETAKANAAATDLALQKLLWLESMRLDLETLFTKGLIHGQQ